MVSRSERSGEHARRVSICRPGGRGASWAIKSRHGEQSQRLPSSTSTGQYFAIHNLCPHEGGPLSEGRVKGFVVSCPWHDLAFDVRNGQGRTEVGIVSGVMTCGSKAARFSSGPRRKVLAHRSATREHAMSMTTGHDHDGATHSDGAKVIEATLDHPIQIHLWEDRTRGELWVPTYDPTGLGVAGRRLSCASPAIMRSTMGSGRSSFKAVKPGTHRRPV